MRQRPTGNETLGFTIQADSIQFALCKADRKGPSLVKLFQIPVCRDLESGSAESIDKELKQHCPKLQETLVCGALPAESLLVRHLNVPLKKRAEIDEVIEFQAEPILPFPAEDTQLDWQLISQTDEQSKLAVHCSHKEQLDLFLEQTEPLGLDAESISAEPIGVAAFAQAFCTNGTPVAIIHIERERAFLAIANDGVLVSNHCLDIGYGELAAVSQGDELTTLDLSPSAVKASQPLSTACEKLAQRLRQALLSFSKRSQSIKVGSTLLTGPAAGSPLQTWLEEQLELPAAELKTEEISNLEPVELCRNAVPIGLAISCLSSTKQPVCFRYGDYAYSKPFKRYQRKVGVFMLLCFLLSGAILFAGNTWLNQRFSLLRQDYLTLLSTVRMTPEAVETELSGGTATTHEEAMQIIQDMGRGEALARVEYIQKQISQSPTLYPLLPRLPTVSDFLAWLSTHPNVSEINEATGERESLLHIESVSYSLLRRPEPNRRQERYQVRVELEFSSNTPRQARAFHDALVAGSKFIDPKGEIKWGSNRGRYKTSFYLKDRTTYPQAGGSS